MRLKDMNRGLLLGAALIVGTTVYVVWENQSYKKNLPQIEKQVNDYVAEIADCNTGDANARQQNITAFITARMTDGSQLADSMHYNTKEDMLDFDFSSEGTLYDVTCECGDIKIKKSGSTGAMVAFEYKMEVVYQGETEYFSPDGYGYSVNSDDDNSAACKDILRCTASWYMVKSGDDWKIAGMSGWWNEMSTVYVSDEELAAYGEGGELDG